MYQVALEKNLTEDMMTQSFSDIFGKHYKSGKVIFLADEKSEWLIQMDEADITEDMRMKSRSILSEPEKNLYNL